MFYRPIQLIVYLSSLVSIVSTDVVEDYGRGIRAVFIGPPGAGKGTQSFQLKDKYAACHFSIGDILRNEIAHGTPLGKELEKVVRKGMHANIEIVFRLIEKKLNSSECRHGFIFDGLPRTLQQAFLLTDLLTKRKTPLDVVIEFKIDDKLLVPRVTRRLLHIPSGRSYNELFHPPKTPMKDDVTNEELVRREDDNEPVLKHRLESYHISRVPILNYYESQDLVNTIDASQSIANVTKQIEEIFDKALKKNSSN